ncbi:SET domain-containing protein [Hypoxylon sp. NC1633]|nr:SET domain-containing protein [Hypoxylon sp. NC1633]
MIEIRKLSSSIGEAAFATMDIRRGTRLAAEVPLLMMPPNMPNDEEISEICKAAFGLSDCQRTQLAEISCHLSMAESLKSESHISREVWSFYRARRWRDGKGKCIQGRRLQKTIRKMVNLYAVYLTTNVQLGPGGKYGSGIFSLYSRISHSCTPNIHNSWNQTLKRLTLHAIHDIKAGDQLFGDYVGNVCRTRQQRAVSLARVWGITCTCVACTDPKIDQLRHRMLIIDQALAAYECGVSKEPDFAIIHKIPSILTAEQALEAAEELMRLLKRQRLYSTELLRVFRECSKYALDSGKRGKGLHYARKELGLERQLIGTETDHLREDLYGAKYWMESIQKQKMLVYLQNRW